MSQKGLYRKYQVKKNWFWISDNDHIKPKKGVRKLIKRKILHLMLKDSHIDDL